MNIEQIIEAIRHEFTEQLSTAAYTKVGMTIAFEKAVGRALLRFLLPQDRI